MGRAIAPTWATQGCWQMSSILMRRLGSRSTMHLIRRFTSGDVGGLQQRRAAISQQ